MSDSPRTTLIYTTPAGVAIGGLADRFKGITAVYQFCKQFNYDFKIDFRHPFDLRDFLEPNVCDWTCAAADLPASLPTLDLLTVSRKTAVAALAKLSETPPLAYRVLYRKPPQNDQAEYRNLFAELFQPTGELRALLARYYRELGENFVSASFRFGNLLGDFTDPYAEISRALPPEKRAPFIARNLEHLREIQRANPDAKLLVTADSAAFLRAVAETANLPFAVVIPKDAVAHPDVESNRAVAATIWRNSFVDYFLLTRSRKVYAVADDGMFVSSGFALRASLHSRAPFVSMHRGEFRYLRPIFPRYIFRGWRVFFRDFARAIFSFRRTEKNSWLICFCGVQIGKFTDPTAPSWLRIQL